MQAMFSTQMKALIGIVLATLVLYMVAPIPEGLSEGAWQLALIFAVTILCVLGNLLPIFTASIAALSIAVLSGVLTPAQAYRGFSESFILLIVAAFLVARGVVNSGLGHRMAWMIIARFGNSTLSLAYSLVVTDLCIAPAFPSNTARSGVLFPIAESLSLGLDSKPEPESRKRAGAYLMMIGMGSLSISSALWMTAMAANAAGVAIAREQGVDINFFSWLLTASVPCLAAAFIMPRVVYKFLPPDLHRTPQAPTVAREKLRAMGPMSRQEKLTAVIFFAMVLLWALSDRLGTDLAAIAFGGLALLMLFGVFTVADLQKEGGTLEVLVWFAILYAMSTALNQMGFMSWMGQHFAAAVGNFSWPMVYVCLLFAYIVIHYFFVSQTAHLLALFPVFLEVGINGGVPGALMAFSILFASNYFSALTPQASSANIIFVGNGYLEVKEVYRVGLYLTLANTLVIGFLGVPWILFINS